MKTFVFLHEIQGKRLNVLYFLRKSKMKVHLGWDVKLKYGDWTNNRSSAHVV